MMNMQRCVGILMCQVILLSNFIFPATNQAIGYIMCVHTNCNAYVVHRKQKHCKINLVTCTGWGLVTIVHIIF